MNAHPSWCAQDHRCTAHTMPSGEHASRPEVWKTNRGRVIACRYQTAGGETWIEIRTVAKLDGRERVAQAQCRHLIATTYAVLDRVLTPAGNRNATSEKEHLR